MSTSPPARPREAPTEVITAKEATGDSPDMPPPVRSSQSSKRTNAFAELMSNSKRAKTDAPSSKNPSAKRKHPVDFRDGFEPYLLHPEKNPEGRVVEYDDEFVVIRDKFPKASVHLLLLPRDPKIYLQHPLHYLSDNPAFLEKVRTRVTHLKTLAARELRRQYGHLSASDAPYQSALEDLMASSDPPPSPSARDALLPPGRDWLSEIKVGVHTHPSMSHMHIHVLSREHDSPCLKKKKHYLSFNTSFLVGLDEFPLEEGSGRFHPGDWPSWDLVCWRCGRNFGNKFKQLMDHVKEEIEAWKKE